MKLIRSIPLWTGIIFIFFPGRAQFKTNQYVVSQSSSGFGTLRMIDWEKNYSGENHFLYFINNGPEQKFVIQKTDQHLQERWRVGIQYQQNPVSGNSFDGKYINIMPNSDILVTGFYRDAESVGIGFLRYSQQGNLVWSKKISNDDNPTIYFVSNPKFDQQGNIYLAVRYATPTRHYDILALKLNPNGNLAWQKLFYSGYYKNYLNDFSVSSQGDFYICSKANLSTCLVKLNSQGILQWAKSTLPPLGAEGKNCQIINDSTIIITGLGGYNKTFYTFCLKIDQNGNLLDAYNFKTTVEKSFPYGISAGPNGQVALTHNYIYEKRKAVTFLDQNGYLEGGLSIKTGYSDLNFLLEIKKIKFDSNGNLYLFNGAINPSAGTNHTILMEFNESGQGICGISDLYPTKNPEKVGFGWDFLPYQFEFSILEFGSFTPGLVSTFERWDITPYCNLTGDSELEFINQEITPNPATNEIHFSYSKKNLFKNGIIYDASGRIVLTFNPYPEKTILDISTLNPGIYYVILYGDNNSYKKKFIKIE
jgi:hypothetical protein